MLFVGGYLSNSWNICWLLVVYFHTSTAGRVWKLLKIPQNGFKMPNLIFHEQKLSKFFWAIPSDSERLWVVSGSTSQENIWPPMPEVDLLMATAGQLSNSWNICWLLISSLTVGSTCWTILYCLTAAISVISVGLPRSLEITDFWFWLISACASLISQRWPLGFAIRWWWVFTLIQTLLPTSKIHTFDSHKA